MEVNITSQNSFSHRNRANGQSLEWGVGMPPVSHSVPPLPSSPSDSPPTCENLRSLLTSKQSPKDHPPLPNLYPSFLFFYLTLTEDFKTRLVVPTTNTVGIWSFRPNPTPIVIIIFEVVVSEEIYTVRISTEISSKGYRGVAVSVFKRNHQFGSSTRKRRSSERSMG